MELAEWADQVIRPIVIGGSVNPSHFMDLLWQQVLVLGVQVRVGAAELDEEVDEIEAVEFSRLSRFRQS